MKAKILFPLFFILCASLVLALPVTYKGDILVNNATGSDVDVKIVTNLETVEKTVNSSYLISIEGDQGTITKFYIWDELVKNVTQPAMGSVDIEDLNFTKLTNGDSCSDSSACSSGTCCSGSCASSCSSGSSGSGGGGGGSGGSGGSSGYASSQMTLMKILSLVTSYYSGTTTYSLMQILDQITRYYK